VSCDIFLERVEDVCLERSVEATRVLSLSKSSSVLSSAGYASSLPFVEELSMLPVSLLFVEDWFYSSLA
jgi:hypothetical protein